MPLVQPGQSGSGPVNWPSHFPHSLFPISLSRVPELPGEENRLHLRRHAPTNSGHLRRRAVGQNAPLGLLYLSTEGISASSSLVAMPDPRPSRVRVRVPASSYSLRRSSWLGAEQGLCAVTSWCGAVLLCFFHDYGVPPPRVARALPRRRGATATVDRYFPLSLPSFLLLDA